ncbi:hypothetical protein E2320_021263, partial [Naja naja]
ICSSICSVRRPTVTTIPAASHNFAVSLHLFSAKAYEFVRKTFLLPEPTILHMMRRFFVSELNMALTVFCSKLPQLCRWLSNLDYKLKFTQQAFNVWQRDLKQGN